MSRRQYLSAGKPSEHFFPISIEMQRERQEGHLHVGVWDSLTHQPVPAAAGPSPEAALGHLLLGPPRLQTTFLPRERWHRPDR